MGRNKLQVEQTVGSHTQSLVDMLNRDILKFVLLYDASQDDKSLPILEHKFIEDFNILTTFLKDIRRDGSFISHLQRSIIKYVVSIESAKDSMIEQLQQRNKNRKEDFVRQVACFQETLQKLINIPLSNTQYIISICKNVHLVIQDTTRELQTTLEDETLDQLEKDTISEFISLSKIYVELIKKVPKSGQYEKVFTLMKALEDTYVDAAAEIYPPIEAEGYEEYKTLKKILTDNIVKPLTLLLKESR
eukprot:snap_masked-scaffold_6-processed-gene-1.32-mRNA-1 protein AED:1.00 eAED:1.00 QI:0/-1/0/0/-1/1/1/0/246